MHGGFIPNEPQRERLHIRPQLHGPTGCGTPICTLARPREGGTTDTHDRDEATTIILRKRSPSEDKSQASVYLKKILEVGCVIATAHRVLVARQRAGVRREQGKVEVTTMPIMLTVGTVSHERTQAGVTSVSFCCVSGVTQWGCEK